MRLTVSPSRCLALLWALVCTSLLATSAYSQPTPITLPTTDGALLAKAAPDECYDGIGVNYPAGPPCATGKPKVNQAYVWGLAKAGNDLWFGTMANTHCLVQGAYLGLTTPSESSSSVCEFGQSQLVRLGSSGPPVTLPGAIPDKIGDFRPPHIYVYNTVTQSLTEKTNLGPAQAALNTTLGLRAAGTLNDVVLLAGPSLSSGLNMFAFRASTGQFIGYRNLPDYTNIRKMVVVNGVLYAGVGKRGTTPGEKTGRVLRWTGSLLAPTTFEEVGILDSMASEIADHEGRLFVTSWPDTEAAAGSGQQAGLYMSPTLPGGGLVAPATEWTKVWTVSDYEPDPVTAATYGGGALASFDGYLYWGTMHVPLMSSFAHFSTYSADAPSLGGGLTQELLTWITGSERSISIFRGKNFATTPALDVVYGYPVMPAYVKPDSNPGSWTLLPNRMGSPLWGAAGFGNLANNYTWTMAVQDNRLWVGTMDWSWLLADGLGGVLPTSVSRGVSQAIAPITAMSAAGADLWYFPAANSPAYPESINGVGNPSSYGIRNMVKGSDLYLGMANPMNLLTDPNTGPLGGWELIKLAAKPSNTPAGNNTTVALNGGSVNFCHVERAGYTQSVDLPTNILPPTVSLPANTSVLKMLLMASSADWRTGCDSSRLARLTLPVQNIPLNSRMYELVWDSALGMYSLKDITSTITSTGISGALDAGFLGMVLVVASDQIPTYSLGGTLSGLQAGKSLVLQNNADDDLSLNANGSFTFSTPVSGSRSYAVTVSAHPTGQICAVSNGTGTAAANITNVTVNCTTRTYMITPAVTPPGSGTVSCWPNPVYHDASSTCTATPGPGFALSGFSGDCSGNTCVLNSVQAAKRVTATFAPITSFNGPVPVFVPPGVTTLPIPSGNASFNAAGGGATCGLVSTQFVDPYTINSGLPQGYQVAQAAFRFSTNTCVSGSTLTLTVSYPQPLPVGAVLYKYGPATPGALTSTWFPLTGAVLSNDRKQFTYTITDNGVGDSDPTPGVINDPVVPLAPIVTPAPVVTGVPTLSEYGLIALMLLMALFGLPQVRQRRRE